MAEAYDFVIFGAGALSALLAGLLGHDHSKRVLRVAAPVAPQRLPRALDVALPLATRPETWRLLRRSATETLALLGALGAADAVARGPVEIVADLAETRDALAHMRHVAAGYGQRSRSGEFAAVPRLVREITLTDSKVTSVAAAALRFGAAGTAELYLADTPIEAGCVVLAQDAAILDLLPEALRPAVLVPVQMMATLTAPARRLAAPVMQFADRGVTLSQRPDLSILALTGVDSEVDLRLASCIPAPFPLARRASSHFRRLDSRDGAPVVGRLAPSGLFVVGGLGLAAAFFAPALARFLAGKASADEAAWFEAHRPERADASAIADFSAAGTFSP